MVELVLPLLLPLWEGIMAGLFGEPVATWGLDSSLSLRSLFLTQVIITVLSEAFSRISKIGWEPFKKCKHLTSIGF